MGQLFSRVCGICLLLKSSGTIEGRKKLQKTVYILKMSRFTFPEEFNWADYGPYSPELANEIQTMVALGLVDEEKDLAGTYKYSLGEKGRDFLKDYPGLEMPNSAWESLLARIAAKLNSKSAFDLELLSSCVFIYDEHQSLEDMANKIISLKPKYKDSITQVIDYLKIAAQLRNASTITRAVEIIDKLN